MDFFLEIHKGECGLGGHFCDHQRDHGPSVLIRHAAIAVTAAISSHQKSVSTRKNPEEVRRIRKRKLTRRVHSPNSLPQFYSLPQILLKMIYIGFLLTIGHAKVSNCFNSYTYPVGNQRMQKLLQLDLLEYGFLLVEYFIFVCLYPNLNQLCKHKHSFAPSQLQNLSLFPLFSLCVV